MAQQLDVVPKLGLLSLQAVTRRRSQWASVAAPYAELRLEVLAGAHGVMRQPTLAEGLANMTPRCTQLGIRVRTPLSEKASCPLPGDPLAIFQL